jgi:transcriptional regulator with XRE-family HTH domain
MGIARQSPPTSELKVFSDRLQRAIKFKKIDTATLAKNTEYKPEDIQRLLAGMREPSMKKLILIANALGCSVDYLLGLTPEPKRASVVIKADTDALNPQSSERGQTSGQISGKAEPLLAMVPELLESDVELLMYIAGFLIERKEKRWARIAEAMTSNPPKKSDPPLPKVSDSKDGDDLTDSDFEEDDLWDDVEFDDEFEDDDFEDDELEDDDDDLDDFDNE